MTYSSYTYYPERIMCISAQNSVSLTRGLAVKNVSSLSTPVCPASLMAKEEAWSRSPEGRCANWLSGHVRNVFDCTYRVEQDLVYDVLQLYVLS